MARCLAEPALGVPIVVFTPGDQAQVVIGHRRQPIVGRSRCKGGFRPVELAQPEIGHAGVVENHRISVPGLVSRHEELRRFRVVPAAERGLGLPVEI